MATLSLFPSRIAFVDNQGRLTPEAYRALNLLFERVGGSLGDHGEDTFASVIGGFMADDNPVIAESVMQPANESKQAFECVMQPMLEPPMALPEVQQMAGSSPIDDFMLMQPSGLAQYEAIDQLPIRLKNYTVATLPAAGILGRVACVTDALAPAFLTIVVGGGAAKSPVFDDGTNWIAF